MTMGAEKLVVTSLRFTIRIHLLPATFAEALGEVELRIRGGGDPKWQGAVIKKSKATDD
jgi:hypothetical protein